MTIIPSRLAKLATSSRSIEEARARSVNAYRAWYRSVRLKIRQDFEKNRNIQDLQIIDMLLHKNQQEYQETMNCWKQERYDDPAPPQTFLDKFFAGRDDPKQVASF